MGGFKTVHPYRRSEERPFPNRGAPLPNGLSYQSDLMREPWTGTRGGEPAVLPGLLDGLDLRDCLVVVGR